MVDGAGDDQAVQALERAAVVAERDGEPVEQLGMAGRRAHFAEIVGRIDEAFAEVVVPDAVDDGTPGQAVFRLGDPASQRGTAGALVFWIGELESRFEAGNTSESAG